MQVTQLVQSKWYTYVGPDDRGLKRGQAVRVQRVGFGSWRTKVAVTRGRTALVIPQQALRGPGTPTAKKALEIVSVVR